MGRWAVATIVAVASGSWIGCDDDDPGGAAGAGGTETGTAAGTATGAGTSTGTPAGTGTATTPTACPIPSNIDYGDCDDVSDVGTSYCFIDSLSCEGSTMVAVWHDHDECGEPYEMSCDHLCPEACTAIDASSLSPPVPGADVIAAMCTSAAGGAAGSGGQGGGGGSGGG
jgi:hypothetical protein